MKQMSLNEAAELCGSYGMPLPISVNGEDKLYLMNESTFQNYADALEFAEVMEGIAEAESGQLIDGNTVIEKARKKYGL